MLLSTTASLSYSLDDRNTYHIAGSPSTGRFEQTKQTGRPFIHKYHDHFSFSFSSFGHIYMCFVDGVPYYIMTTKTYTLSYKLRIFLL